MKIRSVLLTLALLGPGVGLAGVAHAAGGTTDPAAVVDIVKIDERHDVRPRRTDVPPRVARSIDLSKVTYRVDHAEQTLTATLSMPHAFARRGPYRQQVLLGVGEHLNGGESPVVVFDVVPTRSRVNRAVYDGEDGEDGDNGRCTGGSSTVSDHRRHLTIVVPFTCINDHVDRGRVAVAALLSGTHRDGRLDFAMDLVPVTRELSFASDVAPTAGGSRTPVPTGRSHTEGRPPAAASWLVASWHRAR